MTALHPGEAIRYAAGYPALTRFAPGRRGQPLVVFVTGGGVLARVAYGPPDGLPEDFLFHWLGQDGFATLGLSYPIDNPVFGETWPRFGMADWATQCAEAIAACVRENGLPDRVILLGWSMAGRIAQPLTLALRRRRVAVELFVAMAASPPLPNLLPGLAALRPAASGLASVAGAFQDWLLRCLAEQGAGRATIAPQRFAAEFMGDFPVGLAASAMRFAEGGFVADPAGDARETGASDYRNFPMLAVITHGAALDARHALVDRASWGLYIVQSLIEAPILAQRPDLTALAPERWRGLLDLVQAAPARLSAVLPGNHLFFLGEPGARATVAALHALRQDAAALLQEIGALLA